MSGITLPDEGWQYGIIPVADNTTVVYTGRCLLRSLHVTVALSAHVLLIEDTGTTVAALAASAAAGTNQNCGDMLCLTGITATPNAAATGTVTCVFKPLHDTAASTNPGPFPK